MRPPQPSVRLSSRSPSAALNGIPLGHAPDVWWRRPILAPPLLKFHGCPPLLGVVTQEAAGAGSLVVGGGGGGGFI